MYDDSLWEWLKTIMGTPEDVAAEQYFTPPEPMKLKGKVVGILKDTYFRGGEGERLGEALDLDQYFDTVAGEILDYFKTWLRRTVSLRAAWLLEDELKREGSTKMSGPA